MTVFNPDKSMKVYGGKEFVRFGVYENAIMCQHFGFPYLFYGQSDRNFPLSLGLCSSQYSEFGELHLNFQFLTFKFC